MEIDTQHIWSMEPWNMEPAPSGSMIMMTTTLSIDANWPIDGAAMVLSGAWWKGQLSVNGQILPLFYGGNQNVEIALQHLKVGENTLQLQLEAPLNTSRRVTGGTLSSLERKGSAAYLASAPKILLRPKNHISGFSALKNAKQVTPTAWISGTGASVDFAIIQDGSVLEEWISCPIVQGQTQCPATTWNQQLWSVGQPNLYTLQATLKDIQGEIVDVYSERVGIRSVEWASSQPLKINGNATKLMAARMVYRHYGQQFEERIASFVQAGVNTIESHGEWLRQDWLDLADEMGLATVIVPRCVGRANDRQGGSENHLHEFLTLQDQRLLWDIKNHPTVVAFALEGDTSNHWSNRSLWTQTLMDNPQNLPVFGKDLPVRLFQVEYPPSGDPQYGCRPEGCGGAWLVETVTQPKFVDWPSIATAYASAHTKDQSLGGVIPTPRQSGGKNKPDNAAEKQMWMDAWAKASAEINPTQLQTRNRASSRITVDSTPNSWIELQVPGHTTLRRRTDDSGQTTFTIYYEGSATLECSGGSQTIDVQADAWVDFVHQSNNSTITCK